MHGVSEERGDLAPGTAAFLFHQAVALIRRQRRWLVIVLLPTLLLSTYYAFFAADEYESEAHFIVRSTESNQSSPSGIGQALSMVGVSDQGQSNGLSVADYLSSHDAVAALRSRYDLVGRYRRPEADLFSRLGSADPTPERLLSYYQKQVNVKLDSDTNIISLRVRAFRPSDSYVLINGLLALGEQRVNQMNQRANEATLSSAREQMAEAEKAVTESQMALTAFRQGRRNIDPVATGEAQIALVSKLQGSLAIARAQAAAMSGSLNASSPQARAMAARVRSLEIQVSSAQSDLSGGAHSIAANVGDYQELKIREDFAAKRYDAAAASYQRAREQADKQKLFIIRVVDPNMPVKATYPKALKIIATVFFGLALCYGIGWLIGAGVREHAA